jgi:hypothetical protein
VSRAGATIFDCHDFDEGKPASSGFGSTFEPTVFSSVSSSDYAPGSPPSSLLFTTPSLTGTAATSQQFADVVAYHGKIDLSFQVKIVNFDAHAGDVSLARIGYQDADWAVTLDYTGASGTLNEIASFADGASYRSAHTASQPSPFDAWNTVDILVDFDGHTISLAYNGVSVLSDQDIANPVQNNPNISIIMGLNYLGPPANPMTIFMDDIVISTPP